MISVAAPEDFTSWVTAARKLLAENTPATDVIWRAADEASLWSVAETSDPLAPPLPFADASSPSPASQLRSPCSPRQSSVPSVAYSEKPSPPARTLNTFRVPREFLDLARLVAAHADHERWEILYRVLWRLTHGEAHALRLASDPDVHRLLLWERAVRRELHKMTAFVRFRLVRDVDATDHYIAWYEPTHDVIALGAPFFRRRFTSMRWSILSPRRCIHWDGDTLRESPGVTRENAPTDDQLESLWLTYYASIFNPARLKISAMLREMPKRYWENLPETELIEKLIAGADNRTETMLTDSQQKTARHQPPL